MFLNGLGLLLNKFKMDICKYVISNFIREWWLFGSNVLCYNFFLNIDVLIVGRKILDDFGYVSEGRGLNVRYGNFIFIFWKKLRLLFCFNIKNGFSDEFELLRIDVFFSDKRGYCCF